MLFCFAKIQTLVTQLDEEKGFHYAQTFMDWPAGWSIVVTAVDGSSRRNDKTRTVGNYYHHEDARDAISIATADGATLRYSAGS